MNPDLSPNPDRQPAEPSSLSGASASQAVSSSCPAQAAQPDGAVSQPGVSACPPGVPPYAPAANPYPGGAANPYPGAVNPYSGTGNLPAPSAAQAVFAVLALLLGYLFLKWIPHPVTAFLYVLSVALFTAAVLTVTARKTGRKPQAAALLPLAAAVLLSGIYLINPDPLILFLLTAFEFFLFLLVWLYAFSLRNGAPFGDHFGLDLIKAVFVQPFGSFGRLFPALGGFFRGRKTGRIGLILLGVLIALLPTAAVTALLVSADDAFGGLMRQVAAVLFPDDLIGELFLILLSIPVSLFIFGAVYSGMTGRYESVLDEAGKASLSAKAACLPLSVAVPAMIPLIPVYLLFFFSQLGYYFDAFSGMIPAGYSTADYARSGFFQLCAVAAINLAVILFASVFSRRNGGRDPAVMRILKAVYCLFTLILIATALRKMALYIGFYGYTRLRVLTSLFMVFLAFVFLFLLLRQVLGRFPVTPAVLLVGTLLFALTGFADIDARIAEANVARYRNGSLETCDVGAFYELSYTAAPAAVPLLDDRDPAVADAARRYLLTIADTLRTGNESSDSAADWRDDTPARRRTLRLIVSALEEHGLSVPLSDDLRQVTVCLDTDEPVASLLCTLTVNGEPVASQGCANANGSPLAPGSAHVFVFTGRDLPDDVPLSCLFAEFSVYLPDSETPFPAKGTAFALSDLPDKVLVTGSAAGGFRLILPDGR